MALREQHRLKLMSTFWKTRCLSDFYLVYLFVCIFILDIHFLLGKNAWVFGSWLVNYRGGFVRRGLSGEIFLSVAHLSHVPLLPLVLLLHLTCYGIIFGVVRNFLRRPERPGWLLALFASPATFAFPLFDSSVAFRQEILLFALLAISLYAVRNLSGRYEFRSGGKLLLVTYLFAWPAIILCHEGLVCFLPYVAGVVLLRVRKTKRRIMLLAPSAILACVALIAAAARSGSLSTAHIVCEALGNRPESTLSGICSGSIAFLQESREQYRSQVRVMLHDSQVMALYGVASILCFFPVLMAVRDLKMRKIEAWKMRTLVFVIIISCVASIPLFLNAMDWSRWIHIHILCISLLLFSLNIDVVSPSQPKSMVEMQKSKRARWPIRLGWALFATCWNIPFYPASHVFGYFGIAARFLR